MKPKPQYRKRIHAVLDVLNNAAAKELPPEWLRPNPPTVRRESKQPRAEGKPGSRKRQRS